MLAMNRGFRFLFVLCFLALPFRAEAALRISVNPVDGGNSLRLGRADGSMQITKAVRLRVNSDDGKQYQIYQRLQDPLVNQEQMPLGAHALTTYAVNGSNASGTLYAQPNEPLGPSDQLVFTSSPDGLGDTVTLNYLVNPDRVTSSGNFTGRIAYTVRSLSGGTQDQAFVNVYLDASGAFKVSVRGSKNSDRVFLESSKRAATEDGIRIEFSGHFRDELRVYQELQIVPENEQGQFIDLDAVQFFITGNGAANLHPSPEALKRKRELVYQSREAEDKFVVNFLFDPEKRHGLKAGVYRGRMIITVESSQGTQDFPLNVEFKVGPVFDIEVVLPPQGVRFSKVLPTDPPQVQEVKVKVVSNLGKPYVVMQNMASNLVTPKGEEIKKEHFVLKTELVGNSTGHIKVTEFTPVGIGERPLFYSDREGSAAEFKVFYRLTSYPEIVAGDYGAPIVFSLGEM